jgi:hypothetical protein
MRTPSSTRVVRSAQPARACNDCSSTSDPTKKIAFFPSDLKLFICFPDLLQIAFFPSDHKRIILPINAMLIAFGVHSQFGNVRFSTASPRGNKWNSSLSYTDLSLPGKLLVMQPAYLGLTLDLAPQIYFKI